MATLRRGDVELYYEVRGTGAPLLLVAGLAADNSYWVPVVDALAAKYRVVLLDNRGSGRTTPLDAASGIGTMADDCIALVRHLELPKVHLAGHSMGGMIVQDCAIRHPALVDRVVLAATAPVASARDNDLFASWASLSTRSTGRCGSATCSSGCSRSASSTMRGPSTRSCSSRPRIRSSSRPPRCGTRSGPSPPSIGRSRCRTSRAHARARGNRRPAVPGRRQRRVREGHPARDVRGDRGRGALDPGRIPQEFTRRVVEFLD